MRENLIIKRGGIKLYKYILALFMVFALIFAGCSNGKQTQSTNNGGSKNETSNDSNKQAQSGSETAKETDFPKKPIQIIVPYSAGGSSDAVARALANNAEKHLGQPIVVVNKPGGSTNIGLTELVNSKPDGYTVGTANNGMVMQPIVGNSDIVYKDELEPIANVGVIPYAFAVNADSPWKTLDDFVKYAKDNPGNVKYATAGVGNTTHMIAAKFGVEAGLDMEDVPMDGGSKAVASLLGGHVDATVQAVVDFTEQVKAGKLRVLAVTGPKRFTGDPVFEDVPTFMEEGFDVNVILWQGFSAPKGLPEDVRNKLVEGFKKIIEDPATQEDIGKFGFVTEYLAPDDFRKRWEQDSEYLGNLLKETGILEEIQSQK